MTYCVRCKRLVDWELIIDEFSHLFQQADIFGMESLTETQQLIVAGLLCVDCYYENEL